MRRRRPFGFKGQLEMADDPVSPPELKQENLRIYPPRRTAGIELSALQRWKYLTLKSDIVALYKIVPRFYAISL